MFTITFLLLSNLQFLCQSVTHVWMFVYTSQRRPFLSQRVVGGNQVFTPLQYSDKRHYHEIIDCAGKLQMLQHHQGHLTLTNVCYPMIRLLCSEILAFEKCSNSNTKKDVQNLNKLYCKRRLLPRSKPHPDSGSSSMVHCEW